MSSARFLLLIGSVLSLCSGCSLTGELELVRPGNTDHRIVISSAASETDRKAAAELQHYLKAISGTDFQVQVDDRFAGESIICIGSAGYVDRFPVAVDWDRLAEDGFTLRTDGKRLIIAGGTGRGSLNGVYTLLEDYLGCRKYSRDVEYIPRMARITLPEIHRTDVPCFTYREILMPDLQDDAYAAWHKLHNRKDRNREWGLYVHTFDDFIPPEHYFAEHPEYFAEVNNRRTPDSQICLTNPDVFDLVVAGLKDRIKNNPDARYWSVSQNDTYNPCQCRDCRALDEKHGGHAGSLLTFVNRVARVFPERTISTLAYQYTRSAPRDLRPGKNVNIMLCTIECDRGRPIAANQGKDSFSRDIVEWGKLTDNLYLWDYVVQFRNYIDPFPNLRVLQPNIRFFRDNNITMMFQQGSGGSRSEFHELRTYLIAKLLWNPDVDLEAVMADFLHGFYGAAGPHIGACIEAMHDTLEAAKGELGIYGYPWDGVETFLMPGKIEVYDAMLSAAAAAVADDSVLSRRVRFARLPLTFARLELAKRNITSDLSLFQEVAGKMQPNPQLRETLHEFVDELKEQGVQRMEEHGTTPEAYRVKMEQYFERGFVDHLALGKNVCLTPPASDKYPVGGQGALTNGLKGTDDFHCNWLGFEGTPMAAVIDLGETRPLSEVSVDFIQDLMVWIFLPRRVEFFLSQDGNTYQPAGSVSRTSPEKQAGAFIETYRCVFPETPARYIKIRTENHCRCPGWHKGAHGLAWIFLDEIVVR
jgi:hypothetical protein